MNNYNSYPQENTPERLAGPPGKREMLRGTKLA